MATFCPYCDGEIEDEIHKEWYGDYWEHYDDFECPKCREKLEIDVEQETVFIAHKK